MSAFFTMFSLADLSSVVYILKLIIFIRENSLELENKIKETMHKKVRT